MARTARHDVDYFPFYVKDGKITRISNRKKIDRWDREKIFLKSNGKCVDCGLLCGGGWIYHKPSVFHFDFNGTHEIHHIIPVHRGGETTPENLIFLCLSCHLKRHKLLIKGDDNGTP